MNRRDVLAWVGAAAVGGSVGHAAESEPDSVSRTGVPVTTVEELLRSLRKEGFQWRFVGRQIAFTATVLDAGTAPRVRIEGMDKGRFDTAVIHNAAGDHRPKAGDKVRVRGLIVDQWYGVWQVWLYGMNPVNS